MITVTHSASPLLGLPEWSQWQAQRSELAVQLHSFGRSGEGTLSTTLYYDTRGRVVTPQFTPYSPLDFRPTPTQKVDKVVRQWEDVAGQLARRLRQAGVVGAFDLPPGITDVRPFIQEGFRAEVRYTFTGAPDVTKANSSFHKRWKKALRSSYTAETTTDLSGVIDCLAETATRKHFVMNLTRSQLTSLQADLGEERFRVHVVRSPQGEVVSAGIRLLDGAGFGLDWLQGTNRAHLAAGANQLAYATALIDLAEIGVTTLDLGGANIPAIARAKLALGLTITPYIALTYGGLTTLLQDTHQALRTFKRLRFQPAVSSALSASLSRSPRNLRIVGPDPVHLHGRGEGG